jgi:hypothetical protein
MKSDRTPIAAAIASLIVLASVNQKFSALGIPRMSQHPSLLVLDIALVVCPASSSNFTACSLGGEFGHLRPVTIALPL